MYIYIYIYIIIHTYFYQQSSLLPLIFLMPSPTFPGHKVSRNRETLALLQSSSRMRRLSPSCMEESNMAFSTGDAAVSLGRWTSARGKRD